MAIQDLTHSFSSPVFKRHRVQVEYDQILSPIGVESLNAPADNIETVLDSDKLVHSLIEHQAEKSPNAIATQFETQQNLTYQQLNEIANAVARQLTGVRGTIVPIAVSRSINLVVAILAVLKAGAAYVLLSADSPVERNRFIVEDTGASVVIVDETTRDELETIREVSIEDLVSDAHGMGPKYRTDLNIYQAPSDIAYVIYTSGTLGHPKGVLLSHSAAYTGLSALPKLDSSVPFRQLLCHSPNFSAAQRTILGTLCRGGTLCLASKENITLNLNQTIDEMGISSLEITPSMLKLIDPSTIPDAVKRITLGGEAVGPALVETWAEKVELISAYGLSECTQLNMRHRLRRGQTPRAIGKPADSTTYHVLAPGSLDPVPSMVPGELCLGGSQLAEGYLNLPEKNREVFIQNPFGPGRLYRTGDLVTVSSDGIIELIGRIDQQTKIDGQRVEPNESNSLIQTQPGVVNSCVVSASVANRTALVAIIVPDEHVKWTSFVREIRNELRTQLPPYAIPRYWVQRDTMPVNVNGKVDISTLVKNVEAMSVDQLTTPSSGASSVLSASSSSVNLSETEDWLESKIVGVIAEVLSISSATVDLDASFQELGGSSLDAIVVASGLRKIDIHITVSDILRSSSVRQISSSCTEFHSKVVVPAPFSLLPVTAKIDFIDVEDAYPVTSLQESILADSMLGNVNYMYPRIYKLRGVSPAQVRSAMEKVLERSNIYRTAFTPWKRSFIQMVKSTTVLPWKTLKGISAEKFLSQSSNNEAPLEQPLLRVAVIDNEILVLEMHHVLFDFWSSQFFIEDTMAVLEGKEAITRAPFNSYVAYQQLVHNENAKSFWKEYLQSASPTLLDLTQGLQSEMAGAPFVLTSNLGNDLLDFSQAKGVTVGTILHAAWALTLSSSLKSTDVTFLTAFSGRDADLDGVLTLEGPTLCTVPMRVHVDNTTPIGHFTNRVQSNLWDLSKYAHSGIRNALTAGSMKPSAFNTMVNVLVDLHEFPEDSPILPISIHRDNFTQYVTIEVNETNPTSVKLLVPFSANKASAQNLLDCFTGIVRSMAASPDHLVRELSMPKTKIEEPTLPAPVRSETPQFGLAHAAFESFAASTPTKLAIRTSDGRTLTYGELNYKANSFASWLISHGVQHGEMIPLYMEKSAETLISIFGILKAGASFTPLDPLNPHDRNAFIVKDVGAKRVVSDKKNREKCSSFGVELVITEEMDLSSNGERNPEIADLTPDSVIYAIFTSGSTGLPKGVLVQHSAVTASTEGMIEATAVNSSWNALWVLNYVFDASYYDVFTIFSAGATLCLAPQDELLSNLSKYINDLEIEQVMLTPTITKLISGGPAEVPRLKVLNVCGEKIDINILKWAESLDVYNGYGPTEATILMTVSHVKPGSSLNSIGFPLKYATAVIVPPEGGILDRVAHGVVGELCVRGPHLAKGYLNRPEQTAAAFIRDSDGEPLYRTGDLAKWAEDGTLECFGRKDYQIKLNGLRIELGEIENAILHTGDVDAVVVSVAEVHGKKQLVAFCIFKGDHRPGKQVPMPPAERLERVSNLLPKLTTISHYMMPALFLPFESFPTLPSGKSNRKALVALVECMQKAEITQYLPHDAASEQEFEAVSTAEELIMREAWADVLDEPEESIGANSVFLSLGGDSISAINVVSACRKLSYNISVSQVLSNPTLREQAKHLKPAEEKKQAVEVKYDIPETVISAISNAGIDLEVNIEDIYPCGPGQIEFLIQGHKEEQFWNLTACRELSPDFDLQHWKNTTTELTARNQILRTMYYQADPNDNSSWYQIVLRSSQLNFETVHYTTLAEKERHISTLRYGLFPFGAPAVKYLLLQSLTSGARTLCIKMDHGSYDGTLLRIFDDQFKALASDGAAADLPPVNSFKKFIDWTSTSSTDSTLSYWKQELFTHFPEHNLPLTPNADRLKAFPVLTNVEAISASYGVTASTIFQAAYSVVAARLFSSNDILLDNLLTGRNAEVDNPQTLNGTCANFLPFRSQIAASSSISDFLKATQNKFWDTTENGTVGPHDIFKALRKDRQVFGAKLLYLFQPFEPAAPGDMNNDMRWLVMAKSRVFMSINYALMVEVQRTPSGHRFKIQWDTRALSESQVVKVIGLFEEVLELMAKNVDGTMADVLSVSTELEGLWKL